MRKSSVQTRLKSDPSTSGLLRGVYEVMRGSSRGRAYDFDEAGIMEKTSRNTPVCEGRSAAVPITVNLYC